VAPFCRGVRSSTAQLELARAGFCKSSVEEPQVAPPTGDACHSHSQTPPGIKVLANVYQRPSETSLDTKLAGIGWHWLALAGIGWRWRGWSVRRESNPNGWIRRTFFKSAACDPTANCRTTLDNLRALPTVRCRVRRGDEPNRPKEIPPPRSFLSPSLANLEGYVAADGGGVCAVKWHRGSTDRDIAGRNS
jgi:hypothetical protein